MKPSEALASYAAALANSWIERTFDTMTQVKKVLGTGGAL